MTPGRRHHAQEGYTLAELVVVVALLLVVLVPILMTLQSSNRSSDDLRRNTDARAQARSAIDLFVRDLRQAQTGDRGFPAVEALSPSLITFYSPDKSTPFRLRKITYRITGGALTREEITSSNTGLPWTFPATTGPQNIAIENVKTGSQWAAFDRAGTPTVTASQVRRLDITLIVNGIPRPGASQTFTQSVQIRTEY